MGSKEKRSARELVVPAIDGLTGRIRGAAQRMLAPHLDGEAVHDFRVGLRRLRTVLRSARLLYGKERIEPLLDKLERLGEATNALRDEEVLDETVAHVQVSAERQADVALWLSRRMVVESRLRQQAIELLRGPELDELFADLLELMSESIRSDASVERFAKEALERARAKVRRALPVEEDDVEGLHRLRIRFKRLRYTAEMLGRFLTPEDAAAALRDGYAGKPRPNYAAVALLAAGMQNALGSLHDVDQALLLVAVDEELVPEAREELLAQLSKLREELAADAIARLEDMPEELFGRTVR